MVDFHSTTILNLKKPVKTIALLQVVKMFMVVVFIFAVCWLPYHVYFIYTYHHKEVVTMPFIQHVYLVREKISSMLEIFNILGSLDFVLIRDFIGLQWQIQCSTLLFIIGWMQDFEDTLNPSFHPFTCFVAIQQNFSSGNWI